MTSAEKNRTHPAAEIANIAASSTSEFDAEPVRIAYLELVLRQERAGVRPYRRLTAAQLAELLAHFHGRPLPDDLHEILLAALRGERQGNKRGPSPKSDATTMLQRHLLTGVYEQGIERAKKIVPWLKERARRSPRREQIKNVPSIQMLAVRHVKSHLPAFRHLSSKAIANLVSTMRSS